MTAAENQARRTRETVALLVEQGSPERPLRRSEVWDQVVARIPLLPEEAEATASGPERAKHNWVWSTTDLARAGWLEKRGKGDWYPTEESLKALEQFPDPGDFAREARARYAAWFNDDKATKHELLSTVIVPQTHDQERVRDAAGLFVVAGLQAGESVFVAGRQAWTRDAAEELMEHFVKDPDAGGDSFIDKLVAQLSQVSEEARLLMAELVTWQLLPIGPETIGEQKKLKRIQAVLATMEHPVRIPTGVASALSTGIFNPGTRMSSGLFSALSILVRLVHEWFGLSTEEQEEILLEPLRWREFVLGIEGEDFPTQRNSLLYLVRPDFFGPVVSAQHKERIRDAFIGEVEEPTGDIDVDLLHIVLALQVKDNAPVQFYEGDLRQQWDPSEAAGITDQGEEGDGPEPPPETAGFPPADTALAELLFMDKPWLQKTLDLLQRRKQVILYGPPGTGKTFLALALAKHIASGMAERSTLVQFHPSYSYEDFFEGYRPESTDGNLTYTLRPGPMKQIAEMARANPELNYVLIIDEINRGNLAKIFGELYFLLEYRDKHVSLLYGGDDTFSLPKNVFIIGTMNTSDRSIALMDAAMRRRFSFVELHPSQEPVSNVLPQWLEKHKLGNEPTALLMALNARIDDEDFQIGPSYLMDRDHDLSEARLAEIWQFELLPLLEEHHFGDGTDVSARYGLAALRRALNPPAPTLDDPADQAD